ncbi:MAG: methyltransferase [Candidatus Parvarchaeota archaeon]|nr:methyltransferase [Candidatus Rehaiarchaeum fermentans]MCW1293615.1 methyltransferase [Candidatus Rehaiarchaeum fermentans]
MNEIELTKILSSLKKQSFKLKFEQYPTPPEIASKLLLIAYNNNDIKDKIIADLGAGNGIFGIGALILGARKVYFYDIDKDTLQVCEENLKNLGLDRYEIINKGIFSITERFETALSNAPFGLQSHFSIELFIEKLYEITNKFYLILPKNYKIDKLINQLNYIEINLRIPKIMKFHKEKFHFVKSYIAWN